ncbi:MAG: hypothetical protein V3V39_05530 [Desulfobacterales bacterium]|jgi:hypothetical protein
MDAARPGFMGAFIVETAWDGVKIGKDMPKMGLKGGTYETAQYNDPSVDGCMDLRFRGFIGACRHLLLDG